MLNSPFLRQFGNPGLYLDEDVALKYCARLLASSFLLTGMSGVVMPDCQVRVSVKVLAMGCLTRVLLHYPPALFLDLHVGQDEGEASSFFFGCMCQKGSGAFLVGSTNRWFTL